MSKSIKMEKPTLGVCYYPEHWPESLWEDDLRRMQEHGIEIIRIAEFAWSKFEPREGAYTFDFFDRFLDLAHRCGMKVIFGTPTATPPAWLTHKYPEVLNADVTGTPYYHGMRRHYTYNSPKYRELAAKIVEEIAEHYCPHPAIIGWQIDNELNCETGVFYSVSDHKAFRKYLKDRFGTLDALNEAMGTVFWNQTYTDWEEIHLTRNTINKSTNPHMALEEKRFFSVSAISFCKMQSEIIRKHNIRSQFITTNGIFGHLDNHEMTETTLDFITYDSYPNFAYELTANPREPGNLNDRHSSLRLAKVRSISPNFGIMEQQSGPGGWDTRMLQPAPKPGQMRLWTFQSLAHGADFVSYFRWRTCWIGTEIYWHGLNDYSNLPNRRLAELKQIHRDIFSIRDITGAAYQAKIAYLKDYSNEWDGEQDQWHGPMDRFSEEAWYSAAVTTHTPMDMVYLGTAGAGKTTLEKLKKYSLLVYPHPTILTEETAELLKDYVSQGGSLIFGARTGYKDEYGRCPMRPMPGLAGEICGVRVIDYTLLGPADDAEYAVWDGTELEAPLFNDILEPLEDTEVLAAFKGNYYNGLPALTMKGLGQGKAYYYGAGFSTATAEAFLQKLGFADPWSGLLQLPPQVELAVRSKDGADYLFILNYLGTPAEIHIKKPLKERLSGKVVSGSVRLEGYGVMVLEA